MGSVLYAAMQTRPNIAFAALRLARFNYCYNDNYIILIDEIIRYLWATRGYIICYNGQINGESKSAKAFICYNNASFANDVINQKSSQNYIMMLFGGLISYRANRQNTITTSIIEAELLALSQTVREYIYVFRLFETLTFKLNEPLEIRCDNSQIIRLLTEEFAKLKTKLKHINVHNHWL
jgi:hypothetical protein